MSDAPPTARFDTKIAVLVRDDLPAWQRLNVTAFLASGISAAHPELVGEPYADADANAYLALLGQPVMVFEADAATLRSAREKALGRKLSTALFTAEMFATGHDAANRAAVAAVGAQDLDVVGLAVHGPKNAVDKVVKGAHAHP
ncbi:DUF2000 domain-containing protein [Kineococcus rhizosphaerae]|uniref:DUF2000 family protein n=1 Tax=Kineococcus rhizosphaerae TaxID=559628 RepID=A0A2T0R6M5_9ACTN|nr:DUF2000 domain-containing protein [Kineococcus rhizosphaerae]PRY16822.1 hypothetical protein CLV37_103254 [Kineococcus rhizosphaerae]